MKGINWIVAFLMLQILGNISFAEKNITERLSPLIEKAKSWAEHPAVVNAVKKSNDSPDEKFRKITNKNWKDYGPTDPLVKSLTQTSAILAIKKNSDDTVYQVTINAANGTKVGFLRRASHWADDNSIDNNTNRSQYYYDHRIHSVPMTGKIWIGKESLYDDSTGRELFEFSVPIMDDDEPIGFIIVTAIAQNL